MRARRSEQYALYRLNAVCFDRPMAWPTSVQLCPIRRTRNTADLRGSSISLMRRCYSAISATAFCCRAASAMKR